MKIAFPSREFDEAVAAVCHGSASDEQARALNELLRSDLAARDEYILRARNAFAAGVGAGPFRSP